MYAPRPISLLVCGLVSSFAVLTATLPAAGRVFAQEPVGEFIPGQVLVKFKTAAPALDALARQGLRAVGQIEGLDVLEMAVTPGSEIEAIASLRARADVLYAEPNYRVHALDTVPNDPMYSLQWGLPRIKAPQGWDIVSAAAGASIILAVVDTGIDLTHPDFACAGKLMPGYDFVNNDDDPQDDDWMSHGTHVAGIAGACTDNAIGVAGVAWAVRLMPVKVLDANGYGSYANLARGITYATDHGARLINLSLGGLADSQTMSDAVHYASRRGLLVVAAAGNCALGGSGCGGMVNPVMYPAAYPETVAVAATDADDGHAYFSEVQPYVDVSAPGVDIFSMVIGSYGSLSGTSMSTPFVGGLAAIVWSLDPELSATEVRDLIEANADDVGTPGKDDYFGYGRINMWRALQAQMGVRAAPAQTFFIADGHHGPLPAKQPVTLSTTSAHPLTWTASVTPTASWLHILPPVSGSVSTAKTSSLTLTATRPFAYGIYTATLIVTGTAASGVVPAPATTQVTLYYLPHLYQQVLAPIAKDARLP